MHAVMVCYVYDAQFDFFFQVICSRVSSPEAGLRQALENLLDDRFYVPVLRSEDNSVQAAVGEPFSPACPLVGTDLFLQ